MNEVQLEKALKELWEREAFLEQALEYEATAEHVYKIAKAMAFLQAEGTEKAREAQSVVETGTKLLDFLKAKAAAAFAKEKHRDVQAAVSARQTLVSAQNRSDRTYQYAGPG